MEDLKLAMKEKDQFKVGVIRYTRSAIQRFKVDNIRKELTDKEVEDILRVEAKKRKDSIKSFNDAGRTDLADKEAKELEVLMSYLPKQLSVDELRILVKEKIDEAGFKGKADFPKAMKATMAEFREKADGSVIKEIVSEILGN